MLLKDKVIVVTGGTHGIGRGIVMGCVAEGATVIFSGRDENAARAVIDAVEAAEAAARIAAGATAGATGSTTGGKAYFHRADLTDAEACFELIDAAATRFGRLDGLVNNAGIFPSGTLLDTPVETLDRVLSVNVRAAFLLCQRAIPHMLKNGGSIVNIGSTHAETGSPSIAAYAVSKGALRTLTRHIAYNYASVGIRANWITVGWVLTEGDYASQRERGLNDAQIRSNAKKSIPSGRYQEASEISDAAVFLLSDKSLSHTDTDMRVTGGFVPTFGAPKIP